MKLGYHSTHNPYENPFTSKWISKSIFIDCCWIAVWYQTKLNLVTRLFSLDIFGSMVFHLDDN